MISRLLPHLRSCMIGLGVLVTTSATLHGQEEKQVVAVPAHGFQVFGHLLDHYNLAPLPDVASLERADPADTWIIAFGELKLNELHARLEGGLEGFLKRGGAILIASASADRGALGPWKLEIPGWKVLEAKGAAYQGRVECPMISVDDRSSHPLLQRLRYGIATNRPSFLRSHEADLHLLAVFPNDTELPMLRAGGRLLPAEPMPLVFMCGSSSDAPPGGRMAVLSGEGVFINSMLMGMDNDNFEFALNTILWFREGPQGKRTHVLLLDDGEAVTTFALPLNVKMPTLPPDAVLRIFGKMLAEMDRENTFNRLLLEGVGRLRLFRALWIGLGAVVALLLLRRFMQSRFSLETQAPLVVGAQPAPPSLPLEWQRHQALEKLGNYWEPAQVFVRQFFDEFAGRSAPFWDEAHVAAPPSISIDAGWWNRFRLRRRVSQLWRLAQTPPVKRLTRRNFFAVLAVIEELKTSVTSGRLRFNPIA